MFSTRGSSLAVAALVVVAVVAGPMVVSADVVGVMTVREFGVWLDNGDGQFNSHVDTKLACVTNMLQWLSAGTSYGYKQYDQVAGSDLSANPNSSDGNAAGLGTVGQSHATWLSPEANTLQFWFGWSRLDHDTSNSEYATAAKGFNFNVIMNEDMRYWDNTLGKVVRVPSPPGTPVYNNVQLDISIKGSLYDPSLILADEYSTNPADFPAPPYSKELPRIITSTSEVQPTTPDAGWDKAFAGDWEYREFSTDGAVFGNLLPNGQDKHGFVIRIVLSRLYDPDLGRDDPNGIKKLVFYSFKNPGIYDPFDPATYAQAGFVKHEFDVSMFSNGDVIYITDCCNPVPEPMTLSLLLAGGAVVSGVGAVRVRKARRQRAC